VAKAPGAPGKGPKKFLKICFSKNVSMTLPSAHHGLWTEAKEGVEWWHGGDGGG